MRPSTRLRIRRRLTNTRKGVASAQTQAAEHLDKHVVKRWQKFSDVRRFVFGWLALVALLFFGVSVQQNSLAGYYMQEVPATGGTYTEGVVGEITNLNPIFASTEADRSAAALMFDTLLVYNHETQLEGSLATEWSTNEEQNEYTVKLKPDVLWHDGTPLTSEDVVFTFEAIQHPDTGSPLNRSWRDITVEAVDDYTVRFQLPNAFTPFIHSLTRVGILPEHVLGEIEPRELRAHPFNLEPTVGSGPFTFASLALEDRLGQIRLTQFTQYHDGAPKLAEIVLQSFADHEQMIGAFNDGTVAGASGLRTDDLNMLTDPTEHVLHKPALYNNVLMFMNIGNSKLAERDLRRAFVHATDNRQVFEVLHGQFAVSDGPLLKDQLGYHPDLSQYAYQPEKADELLDELGWKRADDGFRYKDEKRLEVTLVTQRTDEYPTVAEEIQRQWSERGITLNLQFVSPTDLQQSHIVPHNYEILLLGIDQGVDPDVFVYWHSSQAGVGGFNLSEFEDEQADAALEAGRTRIDPELRTAKFEAFLKRWRQSAPAVALYRPGYFYVQSDAVNGFEKKRIANPIGRFYDIHNWTIRSEMVKKQI